MHLPSFRSQKERDYSFIFFACLFWGCLWLMLGERWAQPFKVSTVECIFFLAEGPRSSSCHFQTAGMRVLETPLLVTLDMTGLVEQIIQHSIRKFSMPSPLPRFNQSILVFPFPPHLPRRLNSGWFQFYLLMPQCKQPFCS